MPVFLDTRGHSKLNIAICARCSAKYPADELRPDPNYPGLLVCSDDYDDFDPWRLPPRETEDITVENPRPDVSVAVRVGDGLYGGDVLQYTLASDPNPCSSVMPASGSP